ncbi:MAG: hypothetical protein JWP08_3669 [Bryobacterales bacterium]|jgi:hypothetical protein|nr:hypothetical protein [Bryobacterales bacterium]
MNVQRSKFRYYLHDSVEACRLQLLGPLTSAEIKELAGCWTTARTTLEARKLILDISAVTSVDDGGRKWIAAMVAEGASLVQPAPAQPARPCKNGFLQRIINALPGMGAPSVTGDL